MSAPVRCNCRRHAETNLRCARCETPICPDCSIVGVTGMLCRACGNHRNSPLYQVDFGRLILAWAASLAVGVFGGWILVGLARGFGFFLLLWLGFLHGLAVGETALRTTKRKRGTAMEIVAGGASVLGILGGFLLVHPDPMAIIPFLHNPWNLLLVLISAFAAVSRVRNIG